MPDSLKYPWSWKHGSMNSGRTPDALLLMFMLSMSGLSQLIVRPSNSIRATLPPIIQLVWAVSLFIFGIVALVGILLPPKFHILGWYLEGLGRGVLSAMIGTFGIAVVNTAGLKNALVVFLMCTAIAISCGTRAWFLYKRLRRTSEQTSLILKESQ